MTAYSSLSPVAAAIDTVLNVPAFTALARYGDAIPQATTFPYVQIDIEELPTFALGGKPGRGSSYEARITLHAYSTQTGFKECRTVLAKAIELLTDAPAVTGFASWAIFHEGTVPVGDSFVAGVTVREMVSTHRLLVELA